MVQIAIFVEAAEAENFRWEPGLEELFV